MHDNVLYLKFSKVSVLIFFLFSYTKLGQNMNNIKVQNLFYVWRYFPSCWKFWLLIVMIVHSEVEKIYKNSCIVIPISKFDVNHENVMLYYLSKI